jgi:hypothetical protein
MRRRALTVLLLCPAILTAGCTHSTAPKARLAGEILAISGVVGLIAGALFTPTTGHTKEVMAGFSIMSGTGIGLFAVGELTDPAPGPRPETRSETHLRWAKILTQRAGGAAREGNCRRVRRLEKRVNVYNREVHDFVFMRDPEIMRCLEAPPPTGIEGDIPAIPKGLDPGPVAPSSEPAP